MDAIALKEKKFNKIINLVSIVIPLVVALLFGVKLPNVDPLGFLPPIYASINGLTAVLLVVAVLAVKNGKMELHQKLMTACIVLSLAFLVMLVTHIILSIVIIPLVLRTYAKAYLKNYAAHRKLAKITFPLWLYVAVTGVVVYLMISPYYVH